MSEIVILDVGGTKFKTYKSTLPDNNVWYQHPQKDGCYFIDRDPNTFSYILSYLRGKTNILNYLDNKILYEILIDAIFYNLYDLIRAISNKYSSQIINPNILEVKNLLEPKVNRIDAIKYICSDKINIFNRIYNEILTKDSLTQDEIISFRELKKAYPDLYQKFKTIHLGGNYYDMFELELIQLLSKYNSQKCFTEYRGCGSHRMVVEKSLGQGLNGNVFSKTFDQIQSYSKYGYPEFVSEEKFNEMVDGNGEPYKNGEFGYDIIEHTYNPLYICEICVNNIPVYKTEIIKTPKCKGKNTKSMRFINNQSNQTLKRFELGEGICSYGYDNAVKAYSRLKAFYELIDYDALILIFEKYKEKVQKYDNI